MDIKKIRKDFPILSQKVHGKPLVYLDSAATSQKPTSVIEALADYYKEMNANIHRGIYALSEEATQAFEATRKKVAQFIGAKEERSILFTNNTTESINLVAASWGRKNVKAGDEILLTQMEHHSNIVPWQLLAQNGKIFSYFFYIHGFTSDLLGELQSEALRTPLSPERFQSELRQALKSRLQFEHQTVLHDARTQWLFLLTFHHSEENPYVNIR